MKNVLFFLLPFLLFLNGCSKEDPPENVDILIRIKNTSTFDYENVYVNTGGGENDYGDLQVGQTSEYKAFSSAYRYAYVRLDANGQTAVFQPYDFVGEILLENGNYTYEITANGTSGFLELVFKED